MAGRIVLWFERSLSATHRIRIAGELEPVHGHDFACRIDVECADERDGSLLGPALEDALAGLARTGLEAVERGEGGRASAERTARHLHRAVAARLGGGLRLRATTVGEAPGCRARYEE